MLLSDVIVAPGWSDIPAPEAGGQFSRRPSFSLSASAFIIIYAAPHIQGFARLQSHTSLIR